MKKVNLIRKLNGKTLIHPSSLATNNLFYEHGPFASFNWDSITDNEKMKLIEDAAEQSMQSVPVEFFKTVSSELLTAYGFSTWKKLYERSKKVVVNLGSEIILIVPNIYDSRNGSHSATKDMKRTLVLPVSAKEIISEIENAFGDLV